MGHVCSTSESLDVGAGVRPDVQSDDCGRPRDRSERVVACQLEIVGRCITQAEEVGL